MSTKSSDGPIKNRDIKRKALLDGRKISFAVTAQSEATLLPFGHGASGEIPAGCLWFDTDTNALKCTYNNGVITTVAAASSTGSLDGAYDLGTTITVDAGEVTLTDTQTGAGASALYINKSGDLGANAASILHINIGNQTGAGVKTAIQIAFGTEVSADTHKGISITTTIDTEFALDVAKGTIRTQDGYLAVTNTDNEATALATFTNNTKSTGGNIVEISGTGITTGTLLKMSAVQNTLTTGKYFECYDGAANDYSIAKYGATIIAGNAAGTPSLTQTAGDHVITDGRLRATCTINNTTTSAAFTFDPSSLTTGDGLYFDMTSATSGTGIVIEYDASTLDGGYIFRVTDHDAAHASKFSMAENGAIVIAGSASGVAVLTLTAGDVIITSGELKLSAGGFSVTPTATTGTYGGGSTNAACYIDAATCTTAYGLRIDVHDAVMTTGKPLAVTLDNTEVWSVSKTGAQSYTGAVNFFDLNCNALSSTSMFDIDYSVGVASGKCIDIVASNLAHTLTGIYMDLGSASIVGARAIDLDMTAAHTVAGIRLQTSGVLADDVGAVDLIHTTGDITAGGSVLRVSTTATLANASHLVNFSLGASATAANALLVEGGAALRTSSLVSVADAGTSTGASLYLSSASASTAKIAHIVASSASFTGSALYLDVGTASQHCKAIYIDATSAHTSDCVYITSTGVLANNIGVLNIEHAGILANAGAAVVRIVEGAVDVLQGSLLEVDAGATATGIYAVSIIGGAAVRTSALVNISDATSSTGASLNIAASGTSQTDIVKFAIGNVAGTGNLLTLDVGGASCVGETALNIDATSAHTGNTIYVNSTGVLAASKGVLNIAHAGLLADTSANGVGVIRVAEGAVNVLQGALVNISTGATATGLNAIYVAGGAVGRTSALIEVVDAGSSTGASISVSSSGTGNHSLLTLASTNVAFTGTALTINIGEVATVAARAIAIDCSNAQTTDVIAITSSAVLANNIGVLNITHTGIMANDGAAIIRVDSTAVQTAGALCELTDNSASTGGAILRVASPAGARTTDLVNITSAATVLAQDKACLNIIHTGVMAHDEAAIVRVVNNSIQLRAALLELQDAGASTGGNIIKITDAGAARTGALISITSVSTSTSNAISITSSGAGYTGYGLYINNTTGEAIKVDAGVVVFDETLTVTGNCIMSAAAVIGANTIYARSDAASILSFTTADAAPTHLNLSQLQHIARLVADADQTGMEGELAYNTTTNKLMICTVAGAGAASTWETITSA